MPFCVYLRLSFTSRRLLGGEDGRSFIIRLTNLTDLALRIGDARTMLENAKLLMSKGEYERAAQVYSEAAQKDPGNPLVFLGLAEAFYSLRQFSEAKQNAEKAIELDPSLSIPYVILAYLSLMQEKDYQTSYQLAEKAYQIEPDSGRTTKCLGIVSFYLGKNEQSAELLEKGVKSMPDDKESYPYLWEVYRRLKNYDRIYQVSKEIYRLQPSIETRYWVYATYLNTTYTLAKVYRVMSPILFIGCFIGAFLLRSPILFIFPAVYLIWMIVCNIFLYRSGAKFAAIIRISYSMVFLLILYVIKVSMFN